MSKLVKKRVQYSAIAKTGRIPMGDKVDDKDSKATQLIKLSCNIPSVKVSDTKSAQEFLNDDGGY